METTDRDGARARHLMDRVLAFVGVLSPDGILLEANEPAVAAAGVPREDLIGRPFWDCYWWAFDPATQARLREAVAEAAGGEQVRYDAEIRVAGDHRLWIDFQIVPVADADGRVVEMVPSGVDITERKQAEAHRELLLQELSHRVKNTLAGIQAMAGQTLRANPDPAAFRDAFGARLQALAASHDLLVEANHEAVRLRDLVDRQVRPYAGDPARIETRGEDVLLPGDAAHALGLILHELATNAAKHGALSRSGGRVSIAWRPERVDRGDGDAPGLALDWRERGGPPVAPPTRQGFGTRLVERTAAGVALDYAPDGFAASLRMPLR